MTSDACPLRRLAILLMATLLTAFVEEMKSSGFVAAALARHKIEGAVVAPAAR